MATQHFVAANAQNLGHLEAEALRQTQELDARLASKMPVREAAAVWVPLTGVKLPATTLPREAGVRRSGPRSYGKTSARW